MIRKKIAIVGAGFAGMTAARELQKNHDVTVFEKARGVSGRLATRYAEPWQFDHGAQHIFAKSDAFVAFVEDLKKQGCVDLWSARFAEIKDNQVQRVAQWGDGKLRHYVGVPGMNAMVQHLAQDCHVRLNTRIQHLSYQDQQWHLHVEGSGVEKFDWCVLAMPQSQAIELALGVVEIPKELHDIKMKACFALMLGFDELPDFGWDAAMVHSPVLSWISVNSSKPQRPAKPAMVIHAKNAWADENIDMPMEEVQAVMLAAVREIIPSLPEPKHMDSQRWLYANVDKQNGKDCFIDDANQFAMIGDWFIQGRVEAAYHSAQSFLRIFNA